VLALEGWAWSTSSRLSGTCVHTSELGGNDEAERLPAEDDAQITTLAPTPTRLVLADNQPDALPRSSSRKNGTAQLCHCCAPRCVDRTSSGVGLTGRAEARYGHAALQTSAPAPATVRAADRLAR